MRNSLLLGSSGRVLNVISWMKAIELTYFRDNGNAVFVLDFHEDVNVRSIKESFKVPSVLLLVGNRDKYNNDRLPLNRKNVFVRDEYICQWCGKKLSDTNGTIDHVYPLSRGGTNTWRNVVASCVSCNNQKDDLTCEEYEKKYGKKLKRKPFVPHRALLFKNYLNKEEYLCWYPYLEKFIKKAYS